MMFSKCLEDIAIQQKNNPMPMNYIGRTLEVGRNCNEKIAKMVFPLE